MLKQQCIPGMNNYDQVVFSCVHITGWCTIFSESTVKTVDAIVYLRHPDGSTSGMP